MVLVNGGKICATVGEIVIKDLKVRRRYGQFFRKARIESCLAPEEIDVRLGLPRGTYGTWESGFQLPRLNSLRAILAVFTDSAAIEFLLLFNEINREVQYYRKDLESPNIG